MEEWLQQILVYIPDGGRYFLLLFLVAFTESLPVVGLIVPGSTLIVLAGFLVVAGKGSIFSLFLVATFGALLGDLLSLWFGKRFGGIILRMRIFQRRRRLIRYSQAFFVSHGGKSLFFARFLGPIRGITPFIAGMSGFPARPAVLYISISAVLWGICYPGLGYLGGSSLQQAQTLGTRFGLALVVLLIIVVVHYQVKKLLRTPVQTAEKRLEPPKESDQNRY